MRAVVFVVAMSALAVGATFVGTNDVWAQEKKEFKADKGPDKVEVSKASKEIQVNYEIFAAKCSKCHTLARPINTDMKASAWKMYVKRMMNKPDSGISPDQGKKIYKLLKWYQGEKDKKAKPQK